MIFFLFLVLILMALGATGFLCYQWGRRDGVAAGEWESVLARATKANERKFGDGLNL